MKLTGAFRMNELKELEVENDVETDPVETPSAPPVRPRQGLSAPPRKRKTRAAIAMVIFAMILVVVATVLIVSSRKAAPNTAPKAPAGTPADVIVASEAQMRELMVQSVAQEATSVQ